MVFWGDGSGQYVQRSNGNGDLLPNNTKRNYYIAEHTYPGRGTFTISMTDPNRIDGILNINFPNSINVPFHLATTFTFLSPQFQGLNNSPLLLQPPIDFACVNQVFTHNPNAYDLDGDSLAYELIVPFQGVGMEVPNYSFPNQVIPSDSNQMTLNTTTGEFRWDSPQIIGEYNIAMKIHEYRNGVLINSTIRDMQITVRDCNSTPPEIDVVEELCVVAGQLIELPVMAFDNDIPVQKIEISALGGPFEQSISPAMFVAPVGYQDQPLMGTFIWQTRCEHISEQYYQVIFRAADDFWGDAGLSVLKTMRIKVVGPAPEDLQVEADDGAMLISWESPYQCEVTQDNYFKGFAIWKRERSNIIVIDTCDPGLEGKGYEQIGFNVLSKNSSGRYEFVDPDVESGITYCYRVVGEFALNSPGGNPYNRVAGLPSEEGCNQLRRDLPLITKASVMETSSTSGSILISWQNPLLTDLDTLENPGPYRYVIKRANTISGQDFVAIPNGDISFNSFADLSVQSIIDEGINTEDLGYNYIIDFYANGINSLYGSSSVASSVYGSVQASDQLNNITWRYDVPWLNYQFEIFRKENGSSNYTLIGLTDSESYEDFDVENGKEYCYYISTSGSYGIAGVPEPLINLSQEICALPLDTIPPCIPSLIVSNICENADDRTPADEFFNTLSWNNPIESCSRSTDTKGYRIFYTNEDGAPFSEIEEITDPHTTTFTHKPENGIAGCYAILAYDENGNESEMSVPVCVNNCPSYVLPNAFTPNGDGANDLFRPVYNRFIGNINLKIFNRWGNMVFSTSDAQINWDGTTDAGKELAVGVYYYVCQVFDIQADSQEIYEEPLSGFIQLVR
jgi:gliding motility-associated-like protein